MSEEVIEHSFALDPAAAVAATGVMASATNGPAVESVGVTVARPRLIAAAPDEVPVQLGHFRLLEKIGQGGMGVVYRAQDVRDGSIVAVKVPLDKCSRDEDLRRRFLKEGRLLAQVHNQHVARLLEVNEDEGFLYLAMELVEGRNLRQVLAERGPLDEPTALAVIADAARALAEAHQHGIIHRDVKLDNLILVNEGGAAHVELLDFGLARHEVESASVRLTKTGEQVGTPLYMAPEQCLSDGRIGPQTDVYALGANLFHLLSGRPPFEGNSIARLIAQHCHEAPPSLSRLRPQVSEGAAQLVAKALSKSADDRYADAAAFLADVERLRRGEPTTLTLHPRLPDHDPRRVRVFEWNWQLEAAPEQLWPLVSNTERLNRAIGLPAIDYTLRPQPGGGSRRFGAFRKARLAFVWEEHPFEWIEGRRMGVLRAYQRGPLKWLTSQVELAPRPGGGTLLTHTVRIEPLGLLGRFLAAVQIGMQTRTALERVYRRMDAVLMRSAAGQAATDAFEAPSSRPHIGRDRWQRLIEQLAARGIASGVAEALVDFVAAAPVQEAARIRPLALADRLKLPPEQLLAACLHGAREGLLVLFWDIICPLCRLPSQVQDSLRALKSHGHCEACAVDFEVDFASSVEMLFRAHPGLRDVETGFYCAGGPAHSPHVAVQVRVAPGERLELSLRLAEGSYRLRSPQAGFVLDFRVHAAARATCWDLDLGRGPDPRLPRTLKAEGQLFALNNDGEDELVVRIERSAARTDALTAARAAATPLFRQLFPDEVLSAGQLLSVTNVTLLVTASEQAGRLYRELGDHEAFAVIHRHLRAQEEHIQRESGSVLKIIDEGLIAVFQDTVAAVRVAWELQERNALAGDGSSLRVGVHRGAALASTINDRVDYFGGTVKLAMQLPLFAGEAEVLLSDAFANDPSVAAWIRGRGLANDFLTIRPTGLLDCRVQRLLRGRANPSAP